MGRVIFLTFLIFFSPPPLTYLDPTREQTYLAPTRA